MRTAVSLLSREAAGEEEVRQVGAGDQQQQAAGDRERREDGPEFAHHVLEERDRPSAPAPVGVRPLAGQRRGDRRELLVSRGQGAARAEPSHDVEVVAPAVERGRRQGERRPDLRRLEREGEARRQDADDLIPRAAELERPAEHGGRGGEPAVPVAVAEEGHLIPPGGLLLGQEGAAESGAHAEQREEAGRAQRHVDHLGPVGARAVEDRGDIGRQALECTAALAKVVEVPRGEAAAHHLELGVLAQQRAPGVPAARQVLGDDRRVDEAVDLRPAGEAGGDHRRRIGDLRPDDDVRGAGGEEPPVVAARQRLAAGAHRQQPLPAAPAAGGDAVDDLRPERIEDEEARPRRRLPGIGQRATLEPAVRQSPGQVLRRHRPPRPQPRHPDHLAPHPRPPQERTGACAATSPISSQRRPGRILLTSRRRRSRTSGLDRPDGKALRQPAGGSGAPHCAMRPRVSGANGGCGCSSAWDPRGSGPR